MNNKELERYKRHILLKEIGGSGQKLLKKSNVTVIGAGGLGSIVLFYLAAAGVGNIKIVDNDVVSLSNLQRQILYKDSDQGEKKVLAAKKNLLNLNLLAFVDKSCKYLKNFFLSFLLFFLKLHLLGKDLYFSICL